VDGLVSGQGKQARTAAEKQPGTLSKHHQSKWSAIVSKGGIGRKSSTESRKEKSQRDPGIEKVGPGGKHFNNKGGLLPDDDWQSVFESLTVATA